MPVGKSQQGFTYLGVLLAMALLGIALMGVSEIWVKTKQRQQMVQLGWVMEQYRRAIESYYYSNTGAVHFYPKDIKSLLRDDRHLGIKRHLREAYKNPFTHSIDWVFIAAPDGGIMGIQASNIPDGVKTEALIFIPAKIAP